jgi:hypothetical protein
MLSTKFKSVDTNYATRDFTDQGIASTRGPVSRDKEKELMPWQGPDVGSDDDLSLEAGLNSTKVSLMGRDVMCGWKGTCIIGGFWYDEG